MNNESPLVPQGSFLEQKSQGRARFKIAVFVVLAVHGIGLVALLMQGCQKPPDSSSTNSVATETNAPEPRPIAPSFVESTDAPVVMPDTTTTVTPPVVVQNTQAPPTITEPLPQPPVQPATITEYKVAPGDTLTKIARDHNVSIKAIEAANPGIDPKRLRINSILQIPPPVVQPNLSTEVSGVTEPVAPDDGTTYKVKSGDTLIRIASKYGVSVNALRKVNGLRTDRIRVNQVLKIPEKNGEGAMAPNTGGTR